MERAVPLHKNNFPVWVMAAKGGLMYAHSGVTWKERARGTRWHDRAIVSGWNPARKGGSAIP